MIPQKSINQESTFTETRKGITKHNENYQSGKLTLQEPPKNKKTKTTPKKPTSINQDMNLQTHRYTCVCFLLQTYTNQDARREKNVGDHSKAENE